MKQIDIEHTISLSNKKYVIKNSCQLFFLIAVLFILLLSKATAQSPTINSIAANNNTIQKFEKLELTVSLTAAYTNPYDYDDILLKGIFTAPSGKKDTVEGFYMQDFTLNTGSGNLTAGSDYFRIRYAPAETGTYSYVVTCQNNSGSTISVANTFASIASNKKGFIKKNFTNYLKFDNGDQFIPVGQNMGWQQNNKYLDFKNWTDKMAAMNANFIRLWQCSWGLGIEWKGLPYEGLKKYRQDNSFYTDKLLEECSAKDIYMMLCINHHGMVSSNVNPNWPDNPYNAVNGGPCTNTWDYFTNNTAKNLHKNRLRYIIARWGYSRNIMSWELFNEVEWTDNFDTYKTQIKDWHKEMAAYIQAKDPFNHLVTTSFAHDNNDAATWNLPEIDFTQTHYYNGSPNVEAVLVSGVRNYLTQFNKPTLTGEFGIESGNISLSTIDPNGIYFHNSLWATMLGGGMGAGASWWWDSWIEPQNLYSHYKGPSAMAAKIPFAAGNYQVAGASTTGGGNADLSFSPGADWGIAPASAFTVAADGTLTPGSTQLCKYLYGSVWNTQNRNPPTFTVSYPVAGQFKVSTAGSIGTSARISIYIDGNLVFDQAASVNTTYSVNVPAGLHSIKADNLGTDWLLVSSYIFTSLGRPINTYVVKSQDSMRAAGWVHNKQYNWQYVKDNGIPVAVNGAVLSLPGIANGTYTVKWYECVNGTELSSATIAATNNTLQFSCPSLAWDAAFTATNTILATTTYTFAGSGNWDVATNWANNLVPPAILTGGTTIVIDPPANGECVLNIQQSITNGATLRVMANKKFRVLGALTIQQ
ncbi:MAG: DUF5060 domain-containing protein [Chitinophagaceae bacterium]|nr:DUF5060 domain-containing protein [Chitinophagaceae bacterium]